MLFVYTNAFHPYCQTSLGLIEGVDYLVTDVRDQVRQVLRTLVMIGQGCTSDVFNLYSLEDSSHARINLNLSFEPNDTDESHR